MAIFIIKSILLHVFIIKNYKFLILYPIFFNMMVFKTYLSIIYHKYNNNDKNIMMLKSPIKDDEYSFSLCLYEVFIIAPQQNAYLVNYLIFSKVPLIERVCKIIPKYIKSLFMLVVLSSLSMAYIQFNLIKILVQSMYKGGRIDLNFYTNIRTRLIQGQMTDQLCIRIYNGIVKTNGFDIIKKGLANKTIKLLDEVVYSYKANTLCNGESKSHLTAQPNRELKIGYIWSHGSNKGATPILTDCSYGGTYKNKTTKMYIADNNNAEVVQIAVTQKAQKRAFRDVLMLSKNIGNDELYSTNNITINQHKDFKNYENVDIKSELEKYKKSDHYKLLQEIHNEGLLKNPNFLELIKYCSNTSKRPLLWQNVADDILKENKIDQ